MITLILGSHPRHFYFAEKLQNFVKIDRIIIEKRENFLPESNKLTKLEKLHFRKRSEAEYRFFGDVDIRKTNCQNLFFVNLDELNNSIYKIIKDSENLNLITYGCHKLSDNIINMFKFNKWNVHGGISPSYRGCITHFWPSYLLEPEFTGMTLHKLTSKIDGGQIIHQTSVNLNIDDGIHENAARCVKNFSDQIGSYLLNVDFEKELDGIDQTTSGRIWTSKMWNPKLLDVVYNHYEDKINKFCIENQKILSGREINLKSIFV